MRWGLEKAPGNRPGKSGLAWHRRSSTCLRAGFFVFCNLSYLLRARVRPGTIQKVLSICPPEFTGTLPCLRFRKALLSLCPMLTDTLVRTAECSCPKPSCPPSRSWRRNMSGPEGRLRIFTARLNGGSWPTTLAGPRPCILRNDGLKHLGGPRIYLKREDLLHTQVRLQDQAMPWGRSCWPSGRKETHHCGKRAPASTVWPQPHGVRALWLRMRVFIWDRSTYRSARLSECGPHALAWGGGESLSTAGQATTSKGEKAVNEAMRDWVTNVRSTHYILGSALDSHPFPMMVRDFHRVIGVEALAGRSLEKEKAGCR